MSFVALFVPDDRAAEGHEFPESHATISM